MKGWLEIASSRIMLGIYSFGCLLAFIGCFFEISLKSTKLNDWFLALAPFLGFGAALYFWIRKELDVDKHLNNKVISLPLNENDKHLFRIFCEKFDKVILDIDGGSGTFHYIQENHMEALRLYNFDISRREYNFTNLELNSYYKKIISNTRKLYYFIKENTEEVEYDNVDVSFLCPSEYRFAIKYKHQSALDMMRQIKNDFEVLKNTGLNLGISLENML